MAERCTVVDCTGVPNKEDTVSHLNSSAAAFDVFFVFSCTYAPPAGEQCSCSDFSQRHLDVSWMYHKNWTQSQRWRPLTLYVSFSCLYDHIYSSADIFFFYFSAIKII